MTPAADVRRPPRLGRWSLGLLLLAMAGGQLADLGGFVEILGTYRVGGTAVAASIAAILIAGEVAAGVGLLSRDAARRRKAATMAVPVAVVWTILGVQAFARGIALESCGCFGVYAGQPLRWWVLVEDAEFIALAVWVWRGTRLGAGSSRGHVHEGHATPAR